MKATNINFNTPDGNTGAFYERGYVFPEEEGRAVLAVLAIVLSAPLPAVVRQMSPNGPLDMLSGDFDGIVALLDSITRAKQIAVGVRQ